MEINEFILFIIVNGYGAIEQRMSKILKFIHKTRSVSISLFEQFLFVLFVLNPPPIECFFSPFVFEAYIAHSFSFITISSIHPNSVFQQQNCNLLLYYTTLKNIRVELMAILFICYYHQCHASPITTYHDLYETQKELLLSCIEYYCYFQLAYY